MMNLNKQYRQGSWELTHSRFWFLHFIIGPASCIERKVRESMGEKVSDFILRRLREWGVRRVFAYPGDGINGILGAFERANDNPQFIQVRHEELAAFMACAHAKFSDEAGGAGVGVCMATAGPGAIHLLNGLYDAKMDHQPVVAIVGQAARSALGGEFQQEVNLTRLFNDVCAYVYQMDTPVQARQLIDRAFCIALAERTVTCVIVPKDIQEMAAIPTPPHAPNTVHTSLVYKVPRVVPQESPLRRQSTSAKLCSKVTPTSAGLSWSRSRGWRRKSCRVWALSDRQERGRRSDGDYPLW